LRPDVAVVDYHLPRQDGLSLAVRLKALPDAPRVLVYSAFADAPLTVAALVAGTDGIASKGGLGDDLCQAIRAVHAGRRAFPAVPADVIRSMAMRLDPDDGPIFGMLLHRTPRPDIAKVMGIDEPWLDRRCWSILERLKDLTASPRPRGGRRRAVIAGDSR
jgi:DNA-binding NarL/FixJ family response regulator